MKVTLDTESKGRRGVRSLCLAGILVACLGCMLPAFSQVPLTRLQGSVYYKGKSAPYPASYVRLTLTTEYEKRTGRTNSVKEVYTGRDGWYYFTVPSGVYILEVWGSNKKLVSSYKIKAIGQSTTIKMIILP